MLKVIDIHTYYGESHILQGVSLNVPEGSVIGILGRNGMGKTTTLHSINGFNPPRRGEVRFKGNNIVGLPRYQIARLGISLVPQGRRIFPSLTVKENLIAAASKRGNQNWNLEKIFAMFPVVASRATHRGNELSGGEQQMLAIARALISNPDLLLLDEVFEGLSPLILNEIVKIIQLVKSMSFSTLLVEPNLTLATKMADHVYIMNKGTIVYEGDPQDLINNEELKSKFLGVST